MSRNYRYDDATVGRRVRKLIDDPASRSLVEKLESLRDDDAARTARWQPAIRDLLLLLDEADHEA